MHRPLDEILIRIAQGIATTSSSDFFPCFLEQLCDAFEIEYGFIGQVVPGGCAQVETLSAYSRSSTPHILQNFNYELAGTPCQNLFRAEGVCTYTEKLQELFPTDPLLKDLKARSYIGVPLKSSDARGIGLLVLIDTKELGNTEAIISTLELYSGRCASELELQQKNVRLKQIFKATEQSPCSILISDKDGAIEYVNPKFTQLTGYHPEDVLGKNPRILSNPARRANGDQIWKTLESGGEWSGLFHNLKKTGEPFTERATISPIFNEQQEITHFVAVKEDLTSIQDAEVEIRRSEQRFRNLIDQVVDAIILFTPEGDIIDVNKKACSTLGYTREELLEMSVREIDQENSLYSAQPFWSVLPSEIVITVRGHHLRKNKSSFPVEIRMGVFEDSRSTCVIALVRDISDRVAAERELKSQKDLLQNILDNIPHSIVWKDRELKYLGCNKNFALAAGLDSPEQIAGKTDFDLPWHLHEAELYRLCDQQVIDSAAPLLNYEQTQRQAGGRESDVLASKVPLTDESGEVNGVLSIIADITDLKKTQAALDRMANYDDLTGLPNKTLFQDRLNQSLGRSKRRCESLAILSLDLDHFEKINTALGHTGSDQVLKDIACRISSVLRADDTVAKMGGDSFAILLPGLTAEDDSSLVASKILSAMQSPFLIEGNELFISATIGISVFPGDGESAEELLKNATTALNRAKAAGRNSYLLYTQGMNDKVMERISIENNLRRGIQKGELVLYYQPQVDAVANRIIGAEALVRWIHPDKGMISPATFIPLAEETGLIVPLGEWVLRDACRQIRQWKLSGFDCGKISVNIAAQQLMETDLPALVRSVLDEYEIAPTMLSLEITESSIMNDVSKAIAVLQQLKDMGIHLAIDDFGTGYSSLSYLKKFPVDVLKIDRSFVMDLPGNKDDGAIASAIIAMAHNLGLNVLAEGVETPEQLQYLIERNCQVIQGYFFSPPQKAQDYELFQLNDLAKAQGG